VKALLGVIAVCVSDVRGEKRLYYNFFNRGLAIACVSIHHWNTYIGSMEMEWFAERGFNKEKERES